MGFDWEYLLDAEGADIQDAYDDLVWKAMQQQERNYYRKPEKTLHDSLYPYIQSSGGTSLEANCQKLTKCFLRILREGWAQQAKFPFPTVLQPDEQEALTEFYGGFFYCALRILSEKTSHSLWDLVRCAHNVSAVYPQEEALISDELSPEGASGFFGKLDAVFLRITGQKVTDLLPPETLRRVQGPGEGQRSKRAPSPPESFPDAEAFCREYWIFRKGLYRTGQTLCFASEVEYILRQFLQL